MCSMQGLDWLFESDVEYRDNISFPLPRAASDVWKAVPPLPPIKNWSSLTPLQPFLALFINAPFWFDYGLRFSQCKNKNLVLYSLNFVSAHGCINVMDKCIVGHTKVTSTAYSDTWRTAPLSPPVSIRHQTPASLPLFIHKCVIFIWL